MTEILKNKFSETETSKTSRLSRFFWKMFMRRSIFSKKRAAINKTHRVRFMLVIYWIVGRYYKMSVNPCKENFTTKELKNIFCIDCGNYFITLTIYNTRHHRVQKCALNQDWKLSTSCAKQRLKKIKTAILVFVCKYFSWKW